MRSWECSVIGISICPELQNEEVKIKEAEKSIMTPEFRTWMFSCTWICTAVGMVAWYKTTPGFAQTLWEWVLAQDNIWICRLGMAPCLKTTSGFAHLDWDLEQEKYLDFHT